ncbi:MAG: outer membrane protein assembly factor BamD [Lentisphaeria bacterium]|nr:outer membrane protein assembly factor BamD [Lentisphaeria bacterium]
MIGKLKKLLLAGVAGMLFALYGAGAEDIYQEGLKLYKSAADSNDAGGFYDAAGKFDESFLMAETAAVRANSLLAQIAAYRMCGLHYREFQAIEKLLARFPEYADCDAMIKREFEIAEMFRTGTREPSFWALRWIPWLQDVDRTEEIYKAALTRAPFSPLAPAAHMRLALFYEFDGKTSESLGELRKILRNHPDSPESKYASLALANGLFELSRYGDGDSRLVNEAVAEFRDFIQRYPDAAEIEFARNKMAQARDIQAVRLCEIAEFYRKNGRSEASERYLAQVMSKFPDSSSARDAERELIKLSENYLPGDFPERSEPRLPDLRSYSLPDNGSSILISPLDPKHHYLRPVPDLKGELSAGKDAE